MMRCLSLFSGIEAASAAWRPLGWTPAAFAEIEPFPCAVLAHHFPGVPNLGDVTKITDDDIASLGPIDIVVGGSPCQDVSIAGKRAGLSGKRSGLFFEQMRIFHAARTLCGARFLLWENVPGVFSSHAGRDFGRVVGAMAGCDVPVPEDGWGTEGVALGDAGLVEWAVLDAQWFGVPQRRRRCFALLDTGDWTNRPPILLEPDCLRGDTPPRREAGQGLAPTLGARTRGGGGLGNDFYRGGGLIAGPVSCKWAKGTGVPSGDECQNLVAFHGAQDPDISGDVTHPLGRNRGLEACLMQSDPYVLAIRGRGDSCDLEYRQDGTANTLTTPNGGRAGIGVGAIVHSASIRRITPLEAERLQGFPDGWTDVPFPRHKPASDAARYTALGNSMSVPVMRWTGRKIGETLTANAPWIDVDAIPRH